MDETGKRIMDAAMELVMEKGYPVMTTKDIAARAGVNECTIFRKFEGKRGIVLEAMRSELWNPSLRISDFPAECGDIQADLEQMIRIYMNRVTPRFVKVSLGLRTPELYPYTEAGIMEVPRVYKTALRSYFDQAVSGGKIRCEDTELLATMVLSLSFGFVFMKASFGEQLAGAGTEGYIKNSVAAILQGVLI